MWFLVSRHLKTDLYVGWSLTFDSDNSKIPKFVAADGMEEGGKTADLAATFSKRNRPLLKVRKTELGLVQLEYILLM